MEGLHEEGVPRDDILAIQADLQEGSFDTRTLALLALAASMTTEPAAAKELVGPTLAAGWTETEVAHAIFVVSYFNMVTRIAETFALPPDASHPFDPDAALPWTECGP